MAIRRLEAREQVRLLLGDTGGGAYVWSDAALDVHLTLALGELAQVLVPDGVGFVLSDTVGTLPGRYDGLMVQGAAAFAVLQAAADVSQLVNDDGWRRADAYRELGKALLAQFNGRLAALVAGSEAPATESRGMRQSFMQTPSFGGVSGRSGLTEADVLALIRANLGEGGAGLARSDFQEGVLADSRFYNSATPKYWAAQKATKDFVAADFVIVPRGAARSVVFAPNTAPVYLAIAAARSWSFGFLYVSKVNESGLDFGAGNGLGLFDADPIDVTLASAEFHYKVSTDVFAANTVGWSFT